MIDITLLGTAALIPLPERALTSVFLHCGGHSILFDCGEGTQTAARKARISLMKTDIIALTHYHGDHIFGLPGLLQTMCSMGRTEPLYIIAPQGIEQHLEPILRLAGTLSYEIRLVEMSDKSIHLSSLIKGWNNEAYLTAFKTEHRVISQGYVFELKRVGKFQPEKAKELGVPVNQWGRLQRGESVQVGDLTVMPNDVLGEARKGLKFVFSGDTMPCDNLEKAAENADLFICEATYGEDEQAQLALEHGHTNFAQAGEMAAKANVKKLWLAHYSQMIENPQEYIQNAKKKFPFAECGYDGINITLCFED